MNSERKRKNARSNTPANPRGKTIVLDASSLQRLGRRLAIRPPPPSYVPVPPPADADGESNSTSHATTSSSGSQGSGKGESSKILPVLASRSPGTLEQVGREADAAWQGVRNIMSLLNVETKRLVSLIAGTNITNAGFITDLTATIPQGVTAVTRVGDSLKLRTVRVKGFLVYGSAVTTMTLVIGHSRDGLPAIADVFSFTGSHGGQNYPLVTQQPADKWSKSRFLVLDPVRNPACTFEFDVPYNHDVTYAAGSTTVVTGSVWLAMISDLAIGTAPVMQCSLCVDFVDN